MELRQLKYFVAVAEQGSISAASRQLNLAQPAISSSIKKLEADLNSVLFYRKERGVSLTVAGQEFMLHARQILQQTSDAKLAMQNLVGLDKGEVEIGMPSMVGSYYFPPILMAFKHQYPGLQLNIIDDGTRNIQQRLLNDDLELGVIADHYFTPELDGSKLVTEEIVVCMAEDHPLAQKERIEYQDFLAHELALFRKGYYHHSLIERISREENMIPKVSFSSNLLPLIKTIVRQGYAISPMWKVAIQDDDRIVTRRFAKPFYIELSLAWKKDRYLSSANQAFRDFVLEHVNTR
ncbi:LysR family transcriptional regulator [Vibrio hippocampi]|uniref:HTH-type transcriptional regulator GltC n=1 Tax=Vibrio hippocampi TaxID=654686 RepID=A0ABN8DME7_9VIBR|nr:LysR family transcriptional regulator [Vibrio hippocampi]CAH0529830.1 HTH-type transcriptional regulator GltC [Vibrio hippocampi]